MKLKNKTIAQLESMIYDLYYKKNPKGDARFGLWPSVVKAKQQRNKKDALIKIYKSLDN